MNNLGAARIRVRSLLAALRAKDAQHKEREIKPSSIEKVVFTKQMRKDYTILCPQMSPFHFGILQAAFNTCGYHLEVLPNDNKHAVDVGLKYVNNDACYPSLMVVGQVMDALLSGKYDLNKTAVIMSQTGGGCRASNYIAFIRRALKKTGMEQVPVISINLSGLESNPGFKLTLPLIKRVCYGAVFGDILMKCVYRMRPYEVEEGIVNRKHKIWEQSRHFTPSANIADLAKMAEPIVSPGNQTGEGWFLTGEMMELIHGGVPNIVCIQPFACLPNHIVGKGVIKEIRREHPEANIVAIDYDPGASEVNQLNRIKLMLSTAVKNLNKN